MAEDALVEAIIRFKAENIAAAEEARAALSGVGSSVSGVNLQLVKHKAASSEAAVAERDVTREADGMARALGAAGDAGGRAVTRFAALGGVLSSSGGFGLGIGAALLGTTALYEGIKSSIDITEKYDEAQRRLAQAYQVAGLDLRDYEGRIEDFINTNRAFTNDQAEVIDGFAVLTRSGLSQNEVLRAMNDAVDLAALKHISLASAVNTLNDAEHGRLRGLIDLGVTTTKFTDSNGNLIQSQHSVAQSMREVDAAVSGGRGSIDELHQSQNKLSNDWQDLARDAGPQFVQALDIGVSGIDAYFQALAGKSEQGKKSWQELNDVVVGGAKAIGELTHPASAPAASTARTQTNLLGNPDLDAANLDARTAATQRLAEWTDRLLPTVQAEALAAQRQAETGQDAADALGKQRDESDILAGRTQALRGNINDFAEASRQAMGAASHAASEYADAQLAASGRATQAYSEHADAVVNLNDTINNSVETNRDQWVRRSEDIAAENDRLQAHLRDVWGVTKQNMDDLAAHARDEKVNVKVTVDYGEIEQAEFRINDLVANIAAKRADGDFNLGGITFGGGSFTGQ